MVAKVEIIGNIDTDSTESRIKRNIRMLMYWCDTLNRRNLDAQKLKELMIDITGKAELTTEELLEELANLDLDKREEVLIKCTETAKTITLSIEDMAKSLNEDRYHYIDFNDEKEEFSESELRKRIKYCKNPMEKQMLQRELSSMNYAGGKHRKGKRRKH